MKAIRTLQICSYYMQDAFYRLFFEKLEEHGISCVPFVFTAIGTKTAHPMGNAVICRCYRPMDRFLFQVKHGKALRALYAKLNPASFDLIHAHSLFSNGYLAYCCHLKYGTPYVITVRYPDIFTFFRFRFSLRKLGRRILQNARQVVFLSPAHREALMQYLPPDEQDALRRKTVLIPNGIGDEWLQNPGTPHKAPARKLQLVFAGRLNANKNLPMLLRVCTQLQQQGLQPTLHVAGRAERPALLRKLQQSPFVQYHGVLSAAELRKLYCSCDLFIMLSHRETFGLVYAEAMSQGLPVIYTAGQGFDEQFPEGVVGFSAPDRDEALAARAVHAVLGDYEAISARCVELSQSFSWDRVCTALTELYNQEKGG